MFIFIIKLTNNKGFSKDVYLLFDSARMNQARVFLKGIFTSKGPNADSSDDEVTPGRHQIGACIIIIFIENEHALMHSILNVSVLSIFSANPTTENDEFIRNGARGIIVSLK